jgi:hypothetical protein
MLRLLEENRSNENNLKEKFHEDIRNKEKQIDQLYSQINNLQDQLQIEVYKFLFFF